MIDNYKKLFSNKNFAFFWTGQTISQLGDSVFHIALLWIVVDMTGSALAIVKLMLFASIPRLLCQTFGGIIVDSFDRRSIMLISDILRGLVVFILALLIYSQTVEIWHIYLLAFIFGVVGAFFLPAATAIIPMLVNKDELIIAESLNSMTLVVCNIVGPLLGGLLISFPMIGTAGITLFNTISFLAGATGIWKINKVSNTVDINISKSLWVSFTSGYTYLRSQPAIFIIACLSSFINFFAIPTFVLMPLFAKNILKVGPTGFSFLEVSIVAGILIGSLALAKIGKFNHRGVYTTAMCVVQGFLIAVFALSETIQMSIGILLIFGVLNGTTNILFTSYLQASVNTAFQGRIFSLLSVFSSGLQPVAIGLAGGLAELYGIVPVILFSGLCISLISSCGFLFHEVRQID